MAAGDYVQVRIGADLVSGKVRDVVGREVWVFLARPWQHLHDQSGSYTARLDDITPEESR